MAVYSYKQNWGRILRTNGDRPVVRASRILLRSSGQILIGRAELHEFVASMETLPRMGMPIGTFHLLKAQSPCWWHYHALLRGMSSKLA